MAGFYINRQLSIDGERVSEAEALGRSSLLVVLAEPGAGKTDLLTYLASRLGARAYRASIFRSRTFADRPSALAIDAMDEVARLDQLALNDIIEKARSLTDGTVVFASRSGEWEEARTRFVEECFGTKPTIVRLRAFDSDEQRALFQNWFPSEDFEAFVGESERFDLSPLLGNPEFLNLFGNAYIEGGRQFTTKAQIYADAAKRLAHENNKQASKVGRPSADVLTDLAGEVFAKLLLSGATGVSRTERLEDRDFPYLNVLHAATGTDADWLLDSKLFKPSSDADQHEPVHRIVAEYLSARYLVRRIGNPRDRLSLARCLAIIAPSGVVRDELRGMLGWMAALGGETIQRAAIELDPYAVLSNGDPSQLLTGSKRQLLARLQTLSANDPYFRRADSWRSFNVGQFATADIVDDIRRIMVAPPSGHLRGLLVELLPGTEAARHLAGELRALAVDAGADEYERMRAARILPTSTSEDVRSMAAPLLQEGSATSLHILSELVEALGVEHFGDDRVLALLRGLAGLHPNKGQRRDRSIGSRYFIKQSLQALPLRPVTNFLDTLSAGISCDCDPKHEYRCHCRNGISKIVGGLLDRYFELSPGPHDPARVWAWTKNLRFERNIREDDSASVKAMANDATLRRAIHRIAFDGASTTEEIANIDSRFFLGNTHAGIHYGSGDILALIDHAFAASNVELWAISYRRHAPESGRRERDDVRSQMRVQSQQQPELLRVWAKRERSTKKYLRENRSSFGTRHRRYAQREQKIKEGNLDHLRKNRAEIESGQHWGWLETFAHHYLAKPDELSTIADDVATAEKALRNSLAALQGHIPTLEGLAERRGAHIARVLHAGCLLHFREKGGLEDIGLDILAAVKTDTGGYPIPQDEADAFEAELDRLLFPSLAEAERFARAYIEPGLRGPADAFTHAEWLRYKKAFEPLRGKLALEWLRLYAAMPLQAEYTLFEIATSHAPRAASEALISERCASVIPLSPSLDSLESKRRQFWLLNSFFFHADSTQAWEVLRSDPDTIFAIEGRAGRFGGDDSKTPPLSAGKIYDILDAFVGAWPKVFLPSSWGSGDPPGETAYRFLSDIVFRLNRATPEEAIAVLDRLLGDARFLDWRDDLLSIRATIARKLGLKDFRAPAPSQVAGLLDVGSVASVEDLRALVVEQLAEVESWIRHGETNPIENFYVGGVRVDENTGRNRIVEMLNGRMTALGLSGVIEHHMADSKRCDFTTTAMIEGSRRLLTTEVKGQWHSELYSAAATQLSERYASHPDAEQQGIYLVLWYGPDELVANRKNVAIHTTGELRESIIERMPQELRGLIDVVVIDLSLAGKIVPIVDTAYAAGP